MGSAHSSLSFIRHKQQGVHHQQVDDGWAELLPCSFLYLFLYNLLQKVRRFFLAYFLFTGTFLNMRVLENINVICCKINNAVL